MAAHALVRTGRRVLLLERGDWVERGPENWGSAGLGDETRHFTREPGYRVRNGKRRTTTAGTFHCVGGPSVFYGGVSIRFRPEDFEADSAIAPPPLSRWPIDYAELEPYYAEAERIIGVAGAAGEDPLEPPRSGGYPDRVPPLARVAERIADAAGALGYQPFRLPLAINFGGVASRPDCIRCDTCDGFPCAIRSKNDLAVGVLAPLVQRGLDLRPRTAAARLLARRGRVEAVAAVDIATGERLLFRAPLVVLAAGALATPHLILASALQARNPGGHVVGRYLMRHCNGSVYGLFTRLPGADEFHKQIGINDLYFGADEDGAPAGKLGNLQQVSTPAPAYAAGKLPSWIGAPVGGLLRHLTGLLAIAEDEPRASNFVALEGGRDRLGLPRATIHHRYSRRDLAARRVLMRAARRILRTAGARLCYRHEIDTFSHACGTVRAGDDPRYSALDRFGRFRGMDNLYVVDGSFLPRSAGLNPSLTIAANALRIGHHLAGESG